MNLQERLTSLIPRVQNELDTQITKYEKNISAHVHKFLEKHMEHMLLRFFGFKKDSWGAMHADISCIPIAISAKLTNAAEMYVTGMELSLSSTQVKNINAEYRRMLETNIRNKMYTLASSHADILIETVQRSVLEDFTEQSIQDINTYVKTFELISSTGNNHDGSN